MERFLAAGGELNGVDNFNVKQPEPRTQSI